MRVRRLAVVVLCAAWGCDDGGGGDAGVRHERDSGSLMQPMDAAEPEADAASPEDAASPDADLSDPDDDAGTAPPSCGAGECDLLDPLSCTDDTQGCVFLLPADATEPLAECAAVGTGRDGDDCDSYADCGAGLDCTGSAGSCRRYCCALNETAGCPSGQFCRVALTDADGAGTGVGLCDGCDGCDLLDSAACGDGLGCYALPGAGAAGSDGCRACLPAGGNAPGDACESANDCVAGAGCFAVGGGGARCLAFCSLTDAACPDAGECRRVTGIALPESIGLCLEPELASGSK